MGACSITVNVDGEYHILAKISDDLTLTGTSSEGLLRVVFVAKWFHFNDASFRSALNDCIEVELE
jgi:hypothetical protein